MHRALDRDGRNASSSPHYLVGVDVGSTTVKAVAVDAPSGRMVWQAYERHDTRQGERFLGFLKRLEADVGITSDNCRVFVTGSGGGCLADVIGGKFVQEVNAVSLAVERLHPHVRSIIELGGQDAKIIVFREDPATRQKTKFASMNDKCAGGTGAVIDRISAKLGLSAAQVAAGVYTGVRRHPVAAKCGVFAETDINSLQKQGIPADELMASLFDAVVLQNLTVLARGHTLHPHVLLLGGPNTFLRGMREAWQHHIAKLWVERGVQIPRDTDADDLIQTPDNALYFGALGAIEFGKTEPAAVGRYRGTDGLVRYLDVGRTEARARAGSLGLVRSADELEAFMQQYSRPPFVPPVFRPGDVVRGFIGLDGGSTSTKAVVVTDTGRVVCKAYLLSNGNPIQDTIVLFERLREQVESHGARLDVLGVGTTGYAKDLLKEVIGADVALVETVAHAESAVAFYENPDVILDVGGQDIKLIILKDGRVKDFKLNTQCSAGNGYFLQATAEALGVPVERYAEVAFSARAMPTFGYGCAVFLQSDIVNFQRQGWHVDEILAGLAAVLPKNVWLYVAKIPNLPKLGRRFILQGGTQRNLAVVKAQIDYIYARFRSSGVEPDIIVHEHCGECGAIGAALDTVRLWRDGRRTTFIGLDALRGIEYRTTNNELTRCYFCQNQCLRTFIDVKLRNEAAPDADESDADSTRREALLPGVSRSKVPLLPGERRLIVSGCEKGAVEDVRRMRGIKAKLDAVARANPNLVEVAAREVWRPRYPASVADPIPSRAWTRAGWARIALMKNRARLRVGMPRVLNMYWYAPLFSGYLESLGVSPDNIVYSDVTTEDNYRAGARRGSIDPCFPSKLAVAHVHNLIDVHHRKHPIDRLFFPMFDLLRSPMVNDVGHNACPTTTVTPETVKAAFTKEEDVFAEHGISFLNPLVDLSNESVFGGQMLETWGPVLGLSAMENQRAVAAGFAALDQFETEIRTRARDVIDMLECEQRLGIVMLGRPYHHDPGVNHGILEELQRRGYPILSQITLPLDPDLLERQFGADRRAGIISHPLDVSDVWKNVFSASTTQKLWAAKFVARHPNLVALEVSSFKCGHDAPVYSVIEEIIERSGTPYFAFKDVDENKPTGSIKIRVETIHYFLTRYRAELVRRAQAREWVERRVQAFEQELRRRLEQELVRAAES